MTTRTLNDAPQVDSTGFAEPRRRQRTALRRERHVRLFLDDAKRLDFHCAFLEEARKQSALFDDAFGPLRLEYHECRGSHDIQLKLVAKVAAGLADDCDDLICLFPTDFYAIDELQEPLFSRHSARRFEKLVCAVVHQTIPKSLQPAPRRTFSVGADQVQMGQLQAQQVLTSLSVRACRSRKIIYVSGPGHSSATRLRIAGAVDTLLCNNVTVEATHAEWDGSKVREALDQWKEMGGNLDQLDAVAAHNDQIAEAVKTWLTDNQKPLVPVFGMDGTKRGKELVGKRRLAATVVQPLGVKEVFDIYASFLDDDPKCLAFRTEPNIRLAPEPYLPAGELAPL